MTSKASRRLRRKGRSRAKTTLPGGEVIAHAPSNDNRKPKEGPMATVIAARMRHTGITDPHEARQPLCGTDMGRCIRALAKDAEDRAALEQTWAALSGASRNYRTLVIGKTGDPQCASIPVIPDPVETDPGLRVDLRDHETRVEAAERAWGAWEARLATLPAPNLRQALGGALWGFLGDGRLWKDQAPTVTGKVAVMALRMVGEK